MGCGAVVGLSSILNLNNTNLSSNKLNNSSSSSNWSAVGGDGSSDEPNHLSKLTVPGYKWRLVISYDGTRFSGWQYQQSPPTIQCIVEKALTRITKLDRKDLHLVGASRTDKGVHAMGQVAHFITPFNYDRLESIHAALNGLLPPDIRVREISPVAPEFHARFSAKGKIYHYKIFNDTIMDPFHRQYAYHSVYKLNTVVMREAAKNFIGKHDFSAFVNASHNDRLPDPAKSIFRFDVIEMGPLLQLEVEGSGFLYRQVRNMSQITNHFSYLQRIPNLNVQRFIRITRVTVSDHQPFQASSTCTLTDNVGTISPGACGTMDKQLTVCFRYGRESKVYSSAQYTCLEDMNKFIRSRWKIKYSDTFSLTYGLPGYHSRMLDTDEDLLSMYELAYIMQMDRVDVVISMDLDDYSYEDADEDNDNGAIVVHQINQLDVETDLLPTFCSHQETFLLGSSWANEIREVGQKFEGGAVHFRRAMAKYAIQSGFRYRYKKNEKGRITVECWYRDDMGCNWRVHASREAINGFFYIKSMTNIHTCGHVVRTSKHPRVTSDLVGSLIVDKIRQKPLTSPMDVIDDMSKNYGIDIQYHHAWLGVENARREIFGDDAMSFDNLRWYFNEARRVNPGSHLSIQVNPESNRFERCFVAFGACLSGFKYVRPIIFLDGTFLKGRFKGVLLGATSKDGNQGIYPLAFAVVSSEDKDNWEWFLKELHNVVDTERKITFISDRNVGLLEAVHSVFSNHYHAYCMYHLKLNLQDKYRGVTTAFRQRLLYMFRECAYAPNVLRFDSKLQALLIEGGQKMKYFLDGIPPQHWANSHFLGKRYGEMCSNIAESWNASIKAARHLPITNMIDKIRKQMMEDMAEKRNDCKNWFGVLCPAMQTRLQAALDEGRTWNVRMSNECIFEVDSHPSVFVDVGLRLCSCGGWQFNGFPCSHAATVLQKTSMKTGKQLIEFIEPYFYKSYYEASYAGFIHPIATSEKPMNDRSEGFILPPVAKKLPGRPKSKRIPSRGEKIRRIRCNRCGKRGHHNRKSCKEIIDN